MASQITSLTTVYSTVYSGADQRKRQSSASLAFVRGIHRWPVNSPHKGPVTRNMFPFDDVIRVIARVALKLLWMAWVIEPHRSTNNLTHFKARRNHTLDDLLDILYTDGLVQERPNPSALAMELRLSCFNPSIYEICFSFCANILSKSYHLPEKQNTVHAVVRAI